MTLRDLMVTHARNPLTRLDHFGELVTYVRAGAANRQVKAVVNRLDVEPSAPNVPQIAKLRAIVSIPVHETDGITSFVKGDRIVLSLRLGAAPVSAYCTRIVSQDEGVIELEVEA